MHYKPVISQTIDEANSIDIVIINEETGGSLLQPRFIRPLDGFESHRVYCSPDEKRIYLHGKDMRGAIYAIYTFSELFLEVPPLCGIFLLGNRSIRNRWRYNRTLTIFRSHHKSGIVLGSPNDTDLFSPWRRLSKENNELWLETMLRLKLNTVELEATVTYPDYKLNGQAALLRK